MQESSILSPQHEAALQWAERGFPVFPWRLRDGRKVPCVKDWENVASTDPKHIARWWHEWPSAGIGCPPARLGCFVLDIDDKNGKHGTNSLMNLELDNSSLPSTMENMTATGGRHMWFKGDARNSVSGIGEGLDIRGKGGWAALPDGVKYIELNSGEIADAPEWFLTAVQNIAREHEERTIDKQIDEDLDVNVMVATRRLKDLVSRGDVAIEGAGGNDRTYKLAQELQDLGISPEKSLELIEDYWNPECSPSWDHDQLQQIISNATAYRQNDSGVKGLDAGGSTFKNIQTRKPQQNKKSKFALLNPVEQEALPEPTWQIKPIVPQESVVLIYGPAGSYKSFVALDAGLSLSAGLPAWGLKYTTKKQCVIYFAGEGPHGIAKKRAPAWRQVKGVGTDAPFYLCPTVPLVRDASDFQAMCAAIDAAKVRPALIVIDTAARAMSGLDENSAKDAGFLIETAEKIKSRFRCTVLIIHHSGKDAERGARGSSAIEAGVDTVIRVDANRDSLAVKLTVTKQKDADPGEPIFLKGRPVLNSLVFSSIDSGEYAALTTPADDLAPALVGGVLRSLGAMGRTNAVSVKTLATEILKERDELPRDIEKQERAVSAFSRKLRRYADGGRLRAYAERCAGGNRAKWEWFLSDENDAESVESQHGL
jgi:AAA domain-containing protein/bifunctional DNA primase/polymerase-like protein